MIPDTHPRAQSLNTRHALIEGVKNGIVADSGLIAHGRGEAFDYLLGEQTHPFAHHAIKAAAAKLKLAQHPVISINGNTAILCPAEMVRFSNSSGIPLEINLFYRTPGRVDKIAAHLKKYNAQYLLGTKAADQVEIDGLASFRRIVDKNGIHSADVVVVPLEDGDRTEFLVSTGKTVITVDLNPLSRTAQKAQITIVDNIQRFYPLLQQYYSEMTVDDAQAVLTDYDNSAVLKSALETMSNYWKTRLIA